MNITIHDLVPYLPYTDWENPNYLTGVGFCTACENCAVCPFVIPEALFKTRCGLVYSHNPQLDKEQLLKDLEIHYPEYLL